MRLSIAAALVLLFGGATASSAGTLAAFDLSKPFGTHSAWTFAATQAADIPDPLEMSSDPVPGPITLCISADQGRSCRPDLQLAPRFDGDLFAEMHYLDRAEIVHPKAGRPLLLLQAASLHSVNGDQFALTRLLAYDRAQDRFVPVYEHSTNRNNNQEIRYIAGGPLDGAVVAVHPTPNAPFAYWITVSRLAAGRYAQVLRYRSATRYGDGNPLPVIDSEMPNIQQRLGLWRAGKPLPLPARPCPRPHLVGMALWCG